MTRILVIGKKKKLRKVKPQARYGDILVFKTEANTHAVMLRVMRGENCLSSLGVDVKSIRHIWTEKIMLVLKKEVTKIGPYYKALAHEVLGEMMQMRALTVKATWTKYRRRAACSHL